MSPLLTAVMDDRVALPDIRKELVAESLALRRAFHEPGYIDEFDRRRRHLLRVAEIAEEF